MIVILLTAISGTEYNLPAGTPVEVTEAKAKRLVDAEIAKYAANSDEINPAYVKQLDVPKPQPKPAVQTTPAPAPIPQAPVPTPTVEAIDTETEQESIDIDLADLVDYGLDPKIQERLIEGLQELDSATRPITGTDLVAWSKANGGLSKLSGVGSVSAKKIEAVLRTLGILPS